MSLKVPQASLNTPNFSAPSPQVRLGQTLEDLIGNTPLLDFQRVTAHLPAEVRLYAKAEWTNPGGSVKDRAALNIINKAQQDGKLKPGMVLVDSTSGNTGIAYAMIGAGRGIRVKLFLPENVSTERIAILRAYGVELAFTDPLEGSDGAIFTPTSTTILLTGRLTTKQPVRKSGSKPTAPSRILWQGWVPVAHSWARGGG